MPAHRILVITTSASTMGTAKEPTGLWLEELTTPYYIFKDAGCDVVIASIAGGVIPVDARSVKSPGENDASVERYLSDAPLQKMMQETPRFDAVNAEAYDAVFLPGGHGTMFDYAGNKALAALVETMDRAGKVISAVCHGPVGLIDARKTDGTPFVTGRRMAAFTDTEERAIGLDGTVPFLLESRLRALGALHERAPDFEAFAIRDGNLITGQNPASAKPVADLVMEALRSA